MTTSGTEDDLRRGALKRAAAPTVERIEADLALANPRLQRILELIRDNFCDRRLNVTRIRSILGLGSHDTTTEFRREVGVPIGRYIDICRFEVACRLLVDTDLPEKVVGEVIGYKVFKSFSHAFNRHVGCRPRVYRETGGRLSARPPEPRRRLAGPGLPRFVAGVAAVADGACCGWCGEELAPGVVLRVFEGSVAICGACAREHGPRDLVDSLVDL